MKLAKNFWTNQNRKERTFATFSPIFLLNSAIPDWICQARLKNQKIKDKQERNLKKAMIDIVIW